MKTNKVNPLTAFRKLTEARQAKVKKSLKKAQDGIETNDDMINKAGSTGGYKKSPEKWWLQDKPNMDIINKLEPKTVSKDKPWEGPVKLINPADEKRPKYMEPTIEYADPRMDPYYNSKPDTKKYEGPKALSKRMSKIKQKKGGSVKRKK